LDFAIFILVMGILFARPADYFPGLENVPLYLMAIVPCILISWHKLLPQFSSAGLKDRPVLVFGIGILFWAVLGMIARRRFEDALEFSIDYTKMLLFYVLLLAQLDTVKRFRMFIACLACTILVAVFMAVLHYQGYITIESFKVTLDGAEGAVSLEDSSIRRLGGSGSFTDPNDICEIINVAFLLSLCCLLTTRHWLARIFWIFPIGLLGYAHTLTQSRGGLLGLLVGLLVFFRHQLRKHRGLFLMVVLGGLLVILAGRGRQTTITTSGGTGQARIQLWDTAFDALKQSPVVGPGMNGFIAIARLVPHNALLGAYMDLGVFGGALFFGQYFYCLTNLVKLGSKGVSIPDPEVRRLQPFVLGLMVSFAATEMLLTNSFKLSTYTIFGTGSAFIRLARPVPPLPDRTLTPRLLKRTFLYSLLFMAAFYIYVRLNVRY
jgi:O-antigen ligase